MGDVYMAKLAEQARTRALAPHAHCPLCCSLYGGSSKPTRRTPHPWHSGSLCSRRRTRGRAERPSRHRDPIWALEVPPSPAPLLTPNPTPNQAERYEEMVEYMKKVAVASDTDLSLEARSLHPLTM